MWDPSLGRDDKGKGDPDTSLALSSRGTRDPTAGGTQCRNIVYPVPPSCIRNTHRITNQKSQITNILILRLFTGGLLQDVPLFRGERVHAMLVDLFQDLVDAVLCDLSL